MCEPNGTVDYEAARRLNATVPLNVRRTDLRQINGRGPGDRGRLRCCELRADAHGAPVLGAGSEPAGLTGPRCWASGHCCVGRKWDTTPPPREALRVGKCTTGVYSRLDKSPIQRLAAAREIPRRRNATVARPCP